MCDVVPVAGKEASYTHPRRPHRHSHTQSLGGIFAISNYERYNERVS